MSGFSVRTEKVTGSKELRADSFSSQVNAGNVRIVAGEWNKEFIEELRKFPRGKHDDQIDAVSLAFNAANQPVFTVTASERELFQSMSLNRW